MSKLIRKYTLLITILVLGLLISGCSTVSITPTDEEAQVYAYANPIAENMLEALKNNDYQAFIRDYDEAMIASTPQSGFDGLKQILDSKLGEYQSYKNAGIQKSEGSTIVFYSLTFSNAPEVTMKLVLHPEEPHQVTGLWFNSPELSQ